MNFGENLRALRKSHNLTRQQVADVIGVTIRALTFYETGDREPNLTQLCQLADFFGATLDELVGRTTPATDSPPSEP